jgi:hypothetical protein
MHRVQPNLGISHKPVLHALLVNDVPASDGKRCYAYLTSMETELANSHMNPLTLQALLSKHLLYRTRT